jgi:hypothetical protein
VRRTGDPQSDQYIWPAGFLYVIFFIVPAFLATVGLSVLLVLLRRA